MIPLAMNMPQANNRIKTIVKPKVDEFLGKSRTIKIAKKAIDIDMQIILPVDFSSRSEIKPDKKLAMIPIPAVEMVPNRDAWVWPKWKTSCKNGVV